MVVRQELTREAPPPPPPPHAPPSPAPHAPPTKGGGGAGSVADQDAGLRDRAWNDLLQRNAFSQAVERRRNVNESRQNEQLAATRSPWLTSAAGLGYQQSRLGEALFECARCDAADAVGRIVAPFSLAYRLTIPGTIATLLRRAWGALGGGDCWRRRSNGGRDQRGEEEGSYNNGSSYGVGDSARGEFWRSRRCSGRGGALLPVRHAGQRHHGRLPHEWDRTALHVAADHGALAAAAVLLGVHDELSPPPLFFLPRRRRLLSSSSSSSSSFSFLSPFSSSSSSSSSTGGSGTARRVDAEDYYLMTPLHAAAAGGQGAVCRLLLEAGGSRARGRVDALRRRPYDLVPAHLNSNSSSSSYSSYSSYSKSSSSSSSSSSFSSSSSSSRSFALSASSCPEAVRVLTTSDGLRFYLGAPSW